LNAGRERENAVVHRILGENRFAVAILVERDFELAAVRQFHARAQAALAAKTIEHPRHRARITAQLGGLALETVNLLDDFDGHEDIVLLKIDERVWVVQQDVGIKNVVFHFEKINPADSRRRNRGNLAWRMWRIKMTRECFARMAAVSTKFTASDSNFSDEPNFRPVRGQPPNRGGEH